MRDSPVTSRDLQRVLVSALAAGTPGKSGTSLHCARLALPWMNSDSSRLIPATFMPPSFKKRCFPMSPSESPFSRRWALDLTEHLNRIVRFNHRRESPASWELDIYAGPDYLQRMLDHRPGNLVVLSGRNGAEIGLIHASLEAGLNVLADKPWIIRSEDLESLESALSTAAGRGLLAYDIMTERYEITSILQRELVNCPEVFGEILPGTLDEPAVFMESVHHILKMVAGAPNLRPVWFFDVHEQGEALADVGTHLVDLAQWTRVPRAGHRLPHRHRRLLSASRWPTPMTAQQFRQVTGVPGDALDYYCNTQGVLYPPWNPRQARCPVALGGPRRRRRHPPCDLSRIPIEH